MNHLLVLSTPVEIVLVGLSVSADRKDLQIYSTNMSIPSDNINMTQIVSSENGRIFMCGKDGNIYEFSYQVR